MPHVSSKEINPQLLNKLLRKFLTILEKANKKSSLPLLVEEIFTPTEKIMLAKRLAIILLLDGGTPQDKITTTLNVSPSTVARMSLGIEIGKYENILKISKKEKLDLEKIVWNILTVGGIMPPKVGKKYWRKYSKN